MRVGVADVHGEGRAVSARIDGCSRFAHQPGEGGRHADRDENATYDRCPTTLRVRMTTLDRRYAAPDAAHPVEVPQLPRTVVLVSISTRGAF